MRPVLLVLRILIITGALASVVEPRATQHLTRLALIRCPKGTTELMIPDPATAVRLALTAVGLALL